MRTDNAVAFFKTKKKIADVLGILPTAVSQWGPVVPLISAQRLEELSFGNVTVQRELYTDRGRPRSAA